MIVVWRAFMRYNVIGFWTAFYSYTTLHSLKCSQDVGCSSQTVVTLVQYVYCMTLKMLLRCLVSSRMILK